MYDLYKITNNKLLTSIVICVGIICIFVLINLFRTKQEYGGIKGIYALLNELKIHKIIVIILCLFCFIIMIFSNNTLLWFLDGQEDIRLAPEGTYCYYAKASREFSEDEYTLPAKVKKAEVNLYHVKNIYFPNGGFLYFDVDESAEWYNFEDEYNYDEKSNSFNEEMYYMDQNGEHWNITLTNIKANNSSVYENNEVSFLNLFAPAWFLSLPILIVSFVLLFTKNKYKNNI